MYGIILVLVLVATGGVVAYWGDKVGRRIGKKRLSLFGLRPRHTSIVITIITGIVISTATLTILAVVSQDVRTALFGMKQLQKSLATSESRLASVSSDLAQKTSQVQKLSEDIKKKTDQYQQLNNKLLSVQKERDRVSRELVSVSRQYEATKLAYNRTAQELAGAESKVESLRLQLEPLTRQVESLEKERYNLLTIKKRLEHEISQLDKERAQLKTGLESMVFGRVVYRADEIVLATVISAGRSQSSVQNDLSAFLAQANKVAISRGARVEGKMGIAIKLLEGNFDTANNIICQLSDEVVVRLISMTNVVEGEPVLTYFQILPKTKVWSRGQTIATCQIDGRKSIEEIQMEIMDLLYTVNNMAISRGMVADSEGKVGDISLGEFRDAIQKIQEAEGVVKVEAVALSDVWTTQLPLKLKLKISK